MIERLDWDSDFFGRQIGRLRPVAGASPSSATLPDRSEFECVYVELPVSALGTLSAWADVGAVLTDIRADLSIPIVADPVRGRDREGVELIATWDAADREAAVRLAEDLSVWSRFALDPKLARYATELYRRWIGLAFEGANETLVSRGVPGIEGLLTFVRRPPEAVIELLVVADASRGRGIGSSLMQAFLGTASASGYATARVRTQLRNLSALRTYERAGFGIEAATLVLHWWRE